MILDTQKELSVDLLDGGAIYEDDPYYDKYLEIIEENGDTAELFKEMLNDIQSKKKKGDNYKEQIIKTNLKPEITLDEIALLPNSSLLTYLANL